MTMISRFNNWLFNRPLSLPRIADLSNHRQESERHVDSVMMEVYLRGAWDYVEVQRLGAASRAAGDPRDTYKTDHATKKKHWLRAYDTGEVQSVFKIAAGMIEDDKRLRDRRYSIEDEGRAAYRAGKSIHDCPYPDGNSDSIAWDRGFRFERDGK